MDYSIMPASGGAVPPPVPMSYDPILDDDYDDVAYEESMEMAEESFVEDSSAESREPEPTVYTLEDLIASQHMTKGYWKDESEEILEQFFKCGCIDDPVESKLPDWTTYLTLVAIYVLEVKFADNDDEWYLIAKKGREYLRDAGVNTNSLLSEF